MKKYLKLIKKVLKDGSKRDDRTGIGTKSIFGTQLKFNLDSGFPAVTTKKLAWRAVVSELLWFLKGSTNERDLCEILHGTRDLSKRTIWTDNFENQGKGLGYKDGELGPVYGKQMHHQIIDVIKQIKENPYSRRHIVQMWNVQELDKMALPPCHMMFQFYVDGDKLSLQWYQRSIDIGLGLPFNIASYALLLTMVANVCGLKPHKLIFTGGDTHIYLNHIDALNEQVKRKPMDLPTLKLPSLEIQEKILNGSLSLKELHDILDDFVLENYNHYETIKMQMAV